MDSTSRELLNTHLRIANLFSESDWALIDQLTLIKATRVGENSKVRQLKKFTRLQTKEHPTTKTIKETVINLSDKKLEDAVYSLLQKGLNYAVTPCSTPIEDILAGVKKAVLSLPVEMTEEARQEIVRIIKSSSRPRDNFRKTERAALKTTRISPFYQQTKETLRWYGTLQTTNRRSPPSWKTQHIEN